MQFKAKVALLVMKTLCDVLNLQAVGFYSLFCLGQLGNKGAITMNSILIILKIKLSVKNHMLVL